MWATRVVLKQIDRLSLVFLRKGPTKHPQTPAGLSFLAKDHGRSGSRRCDHNTERAGRTDVPWPAGSVDA
jgi:hypothetical protein